MGAASADEALPKQVEEPVMEPEAQTSKPETDLPKPVLSPQMDATYLVQKGIVEQVRTGKIKLIDNKTKGNFGEMATDVEMIDKGWTPKHRRITDLNAHNEHGIDHVFTKPGPPEITLVVDSKYGSSKLSKLVDGTRQMRDTWIEDRLVDSVGLEAAENIVNQGYSAIVAKISADGKIIYKLLNYEGKVIGTFQP